jgi:hypothetical protein
VVLILGAQRKAIEVHGLDFAEGTDGDTLWLTEKLWHMAHLMGFIMGFNEIYLLAICYI